MLSAQQPAKSQHHDHGACLGPNSLLDTTQHPSVTSYMSLARRASALDHDGQAGFKSLRLSPPTQRGRNRERNNGVSPKPLNPIHAKAQPSCFHRLAGDKSVQQDTRLIQTSLPGLGSLAVFSGCARNQLAQQATLPGLGRTSAAFHRC